MLDTIVKLTTAGFAGVGVVIFLLVFTLLKSGKPVDSASAALYNRFLTMGVVFAIFCGAMSLLSHWLTPAPAEAAVLVNVSPSFQTRKLTPPTVEINGRKVQPGQPMTLTGTETIFIGVDQALAEVDAIKETVRNVSNSNAALTEQRSALTDALPIGAAPSQSADVIKSASAEATQLQAQVQSGIASGDFRGAAAASKRLNSARILAAPAVEAIREQAAP